MPSNSSGTQRPSLRSELGLDLEEFVALPPDQRAQAALRAVPDLHGFLNDAVPIGERAEPPRTRELAESLLAAVRPVHRGDHGAERELIDRIVTDGLLRAECDRDQNVYLGTFFTRRLSNAVPDVVFQPTGAREVAATMAWSVERGVPVTLRGAATTAMGGAIPAEGGVVLDLSRLDAVAIDPERECVRFGAGTRMRPLHAALAGEGHALPAYPSNLGGTFAGWLATGGIGMNAYGHGRALDAVRSARVVLPDGALLRLFRDGSVEVEGDDGPTTVAADEAADWFAGRGVPRVRLEDLAGSEGQFGALVEIECDLEPLPVLCPFLLAFDDVEHALGTVERLAAGSIAAVPADVKLLTGSHLHHVRAVWAEEDARGWKHLPSELASDAQLPWSRVAGPAEAGCAVREGVDGDAFLFVDFLDLESARAFAALVPELPGAPRVSDGESVRFARDRFRPQQVKRMGPGFLAAEILLPAARVPGFLAAAEALAESAGAELDAEVYYLADGTALAITGYLTDHRSGSFHVDLLLAPAFLDLAVQSFEGRPYVLGRWQASFFDRKFDSAEARRLTALKQGLDAPHRLGRGAFFAMGLAGPLGWATARGMRPGVRAFRTALGLVPGVVRFARGVLGKLGGPAAGRGSSAPETPVVPGERAAGRNATGRALTCVNCGECNSVCPIFHESKIRLPQMLTHLGEGVHGGEALGESGTTLLDLCMRCGNCEEVCQAGIPHLPLYDEMQKVSDRERPKDRARHVLLLERLRSSMRYMRGFLDTRPGGYLKRTAASLPGVARFVLMREEGEAGPSATCIHCAACVDVCPTNANHEYEGEDARWITTDQSRCIGCGTCVEVCPANLANGGRTLRVMEAPTLSWFDAAREFATQEER